MFSKRSLLLAAAVGFAAGAAETAPFISLGSFLPEIKSYYRTPVSRTRWIWVRKPGDPYAKDQDITQVFNESPRKVFLRKTFEIDGKVRRAWIRYIVDKRGRGYLNGVPLAKLPDPEAAKIRNEQTVWYLDMTGKFKPGKNVLAFEVEGNLCGWRGLLLTGEIELASGRKIPICSDREFKGSDAPEKDWMTPAFDDAKWRPAWEQGDVRMGPYQIRFPVAKFFCTPEEYEAYRTAVAGECAAVSSLSGEPAPRGKSVNGGDLPGFEIDGRILPPVMDLTFLGASENRDNIVAKMYASGVRVFMAGLPDATLYGNPEAEWVVDLGISRLLKLAPDARIILQTAVMQEKEWLKQHPDERVGYANPVKPRAGGRPDDDGYFGGQLAPSFASQAYRRKVAANFIDFMKYAAKKPWRSRIIGFSIGYGPSGDGLPFGVVNGMPDCGVRMTEAFRRYLKEEYKTDAALRKAWGDPAVTLETAAVPDKIQRLGQGYFLHDPAEPRDRRLLDYHRCYHRELGDFVISVGRELKTTFPGRMFGAYFGYVGVHYPAVGVTSMFERVIASPYVDWNMGTVYGYHRSDCLHLSAPMAYRAAGKLSSSEADIRTHIAFASRPDNPVTRMSKTPAQTESTVKKMLATTLLNGCGVHFNCFATTPDWFNTDAVLKPLARHIGIWRERFEKKFSASPEILVVVDPVQRALQGPPEMEDPKRLGNDNFFGLFHRAMLNALSYSGFAYGVTTLETLLAGGPNAKVFIFVNCYEVNGQKREVLLKRIRRPGVTSFWFYAPGLISDRGFSDEAMSSLTGLTLQAEYKPLPLAAKETSGRNLPCKLVESPRVRCTDPAAEKKAVYVSTQETAVARKKLADGSVAVFSGLPILRSDTWADLLAQAGCHRYAKQGNFIRAKGDLLMLAVRTRGDHAVKLPFKAKRIVDLHSGETAGAETDTIRVTSCDWTTWLWKIER